MAHIHIYNYRNGHTTKEAKGKIDQRNLDTYTRSDGV
jgi:hypothetical protein